jgi:hypothetical protein
MTTDTAIQPKKLSNGVNGHNIAPDVMEQIEKRRDVRKTGAVSKCTPERVDQILDDIESGLTETEACTKNGITIQCLWNWKQIVPGFVEAIAQAHKCQMSARLDKRRDDMEQLDVDTLDPKLAMAHLRKQEQLFKADLEVAKRRDPETWGDKQQNINLNVNAEVSPVDLSKFGFGGK